MEDERLGKLGRKLFKPDRVHLNKTGEFAMTYHFLKCQGAPHLVSKVVLNAELGKDRILCQDNCQIEELQFVGDSVSFQLLEHSLPYPAKEIPDDSLDLVPFLQDLNQQILKIESLPDGTYQLFIDGKPIDAYRETELANSINLAGCSHTPQNRQAQAVAELNAERHELTAEKLRHIAMIEYCWLRQPEPIASIEEARQVVERLSKDQGSATRERDTSVLDRYLYEKSCRDETVQSIALATDQMWEINRPVWHEFHLQRIS